MFAAGVARLGSAVDDVPARWGAQSFERVGGSSALSSIPVRNEDRNMQTGGCRLGADRFGWAEHAGCALMATPFAKGRFIEE